MTINLTVPQTMQELRPRITVVGVGGAGCNAVNNMINANLEGVDFLAENSTISLDRMPLGDEGSTFVIFDRKEVKQRFLVLKKFFNFFLQGVFEQAKFSCILRFTSKEIDPATGEPEEEGYDDEYTLEDVDLKLTDYLRPTNISNFKKVKTSWKMKNQLFSF